ncbi:MAG: flotillin family protein, partial [Candidatus Eisenbacteria bacterium]|nr:flotillin family protein [Candidatus Eisenbacteria bacterium]
DESGYIEAIGQKAASEAINQAKVEVAEAVKVGSIGEAVANREQAVEVSNQSAESAMGQKAAERNQRVAIAQLEAEGIAGEADSNKEKEIAIATQGALAAQGKKEADAKLRIKVASLEAEAVEGENSSKASIADYNANLAERKAEAQRRGDVALAEAQRDVLRAEKEREVALLEKEQLAHQEVEKAKIQVDAEAEAERIRRVARGEADAILAKYTAESEGIEKVLRAKAMGYQQLIEICGDRKDLAPALLMVEQLPELVSEQVKAIQNLKIDKITVWDSAGGDGVNGSSTAGFLKSLIGSLPPMHELAAQAGIDLPEVLGKVEDPRRRRKSSNGQPPRESEADTKTE